MTNTGPDDREPIVDADVDRAWRAQSREEPSASLDASILAAARRAAGAHPQAVDPRETSAARRRWWPLAAAATVAAIAVGVLQLTPPEHLGAPSAGNATVSDMPAPPSKKTEAVPATPAVPAEAAPAAPPAPAASATPSQPTASRRDREVLRQRTEVRPSAPPPPAPASAPPPAPASAPRPEPYVAAPAITGNVAAVPPMQAAGIAAAPGARKPEGATPTAPPLAKMAAPGAADAAPASRIKDRAPLTVPDWIALIRRLRDEGQAAEAAKELAAFRALHLDHEKLLPPDLRDWHPAE